MHSVFFLSLFSVYLTKILLNTTVYFFQVFIHEWNIAHNILMNSESTLNTDFAVVNKALATIAEHQNNEIKIWKLSSILKPSLWGLILKSGHTVSLLTRRAFTFIVTTRLLRKRGLSSSSERELTVGGNFSPLKSCKPELDCSSLGAPQSPVLCLLPWVMWVIHYVEWSDRVC